jgi:hypothetical protein
MLPIFSPHPRGYTNPVVLRVSAALPAAGAWDVAPLESSVAFAEHITLAFTYTRGAAGGAVDWQLEVSPYAVAANVPAGASEWITESIYQGGAVVAGADTQSRAQQEYQTYQATGAGAEDFVFGPIELHSMIERARIRARESGSVANPGTFQITAEIV